MNINLAIARRIIDAAEKCGAELQLSPLTIVVLDAAGQLVAAIRQDGSALRRFDIAHGKAYGALAMGVGSRAIMARAETQPQFVAAVGATLGGALIPAPGGALLFQAGVVVGAIGVSGDASDNDEAVAVAGAVAVGLTPVTG